MCGHWKTVGMFQSITYAVSCGWYLPRTVSSFFLFLWGPEIQVLLVISITHSKGVSCVEGMHPLVLVGKGPWWRCTVISRAHLLGMVGWGL